MTTASPMSGADRIEVHEHFDCAQHELWEAIVDGEQLSEWFGGHCRIDPHVGGEVVFDLPGDGVVATGVVRSCVEPRPANHVAHLEHTFVDAARPDLAAVCSWSVVRGDAREDGCDLHFAMDAAGEAASAGLAGVWNRLSDARDEPSVSRDEARDALASARSVLLVDWIGEEVPRAIVKVAPVVYGKVGPKPEDWALVEPDGDGIRTTRIAIPDHADVLHLDWTLGFDEFVGVARDLGVQTFWYHSARTRPPTPADNRGCWVPARQSERQRRIVEDAGMRYIDNHYIADMAREVTATR